MKIIGKTHNGYIAELSKDEANKLTGIDEPWSGHALQVGGDIRVVSFSRHIKDLDYTAEQRKQAAEQLRAAAVIIEATPTAFTAPEPPADPPQPVP